MGGTNMTLYPVGYGTRMVTLEQLQEHFDVSLGIRLHPAFRERIWPFLESQEGRLGIGSGARLIQPVKPGFAPPGRSFHEKQIFASGFEGYCAFDLVATNPGGVHRAPAWSEVPVQGSAWAERVGVHCNIGTPGTPGSESWHMQPVELDGWASWIEAGRPDPVLGYLLPGVPPEPVVPPIIEPNPGDIDMASFAKIDPSDSALLIVDATSARWLQNADEVRAAETVCQNTPADPIILLPLDCEARVWIGRLPHYKKGANAGSVRVTAELWAQTV